MINIYLVKFHEILLFAYESIFKKYIWIVNFEWAYYSVTFSHYL